MSGTRSRSYAKETTSSHSHTKRTRRNSAETRRAILEAAQRRLLSGGPEAIRLQKIAADVGLSHPAILHHFENRDGLVEAMVIDGLSRLQSQFLEGWSSEKEPDLEGIFERFYEVASKGGIARLLAWLILSGRDLGAMKPNALRPAAERMHAGRVRRAQRDGRPIPEIQETQFAATFLVILVLGDSLFGTTARRALGLRSSAAITQRFRRWLIAIVERLGSGGKSSVSLEGQFSAR